MNSLRSALYIIPIMALSCCSPLKDKNFKKMQLIKTYCPYQADAHVYRVYGHTYRILKTNKHYHEKGIASWYGKAFNNKRTSSGERYNMYQLTAAHKTLPLPSYVKVTNLNNGRSVIVKVNDRGPFVEGRLIDLSYAAAKQLHMVGAGTAPVSISSIAHA